MKIDKALQSAFEQFRTGNLNEAEILYKKVLKAKPNNIDALHNLGLICYQRADYDAAIRYIQKELQYNPTDADANNNMGLALEGEGRHDEAAGFYLRATQSNPTFSGAFYNLGNSLKDSGKIDEAIACYQKALQLDPSLAYAYNNLGVVYEKKGELDEAIKYFQKALQVNPSLANTHYNLGLSVLRKGDIDEAIRCYRKALQFNPNYAEVYKDLGVALHVKGQRDEAIKCYRKAIELNPNQPKALNDLGLALQEQGQLDEATSCYQKAISLKPDFTDAYNNLGNISKDIGNLQEAQEYYRHVLTIKPNYSITFSNILFTMNYDPRYDAGSVFKKHLEFAREIAGPLSSAPVRHSNDRDPDRRLKIGYVSPDFRSHSVAYFIEPVLSSHNHEKYEIFCYSDVLHPDEVTDRIQKHADQWRNIVGMSDEAVCEGIRIDKIDILIDLAGHTAGNRMPLFARKPAPVQMSWMGYPATTGLSAVSYKIVDSYTDPPGMTEQFYTEDLIRMPESFLCYLPDEESPDIRPLPSLTEGRITFGSFNNFAKVSTEILGTWARILKKLPDSRLILKSQVFTVETPRRRVIDIFEKEGVSSERIEFMTFEQSVKNHLDLYNRIDIALDTFPYHGTTTTCEALWMGVPVITLAGNAHVSRVGVSLLSNVGLPELVASTAEEYIMKAVNLANDKDRLKSLREQLRQMMRNSPLTDQRRFTAQLEQTYREIWGKWCAAGQA